MDEFPNGFMGFSPAIIGGKLSADNRTQAADNVGALFGLGVSDGTGSRDGSRFKVEKKAVDVGGSQIDGQGKLSLRRRGDNGAGRRRGDFTGFV